MLLLAWQLCLPSLHELLLRPYLLLVLALLLLLRGLLLALVLRNILLLQQFLGRGAQGCWGHGHPKRPLVLRMHGS